MDGPKGMIAVLRIQVRIAACRFCMENEDGIYGIISHNQQQVRNTTLNDEINPRSFQTVQVKMSYGKMPD